MDYFRRDSYHAGVAYGNYDFDRLFLTCTLIEEPQSGKKHFGLLEKGMRAYESFRLARFNLWEQVYEHHARLISDDMLIRAFSQAVEEGIILRDFLDLRGCSPNNFCRYYKYLDDHSIQHEILSKSNSIAKEFIESIRKRKLFKRAYITRADSQGIRDYNTRMQILQADFDDLTEIETDLAIEADIDLDNVILHIQNSKIKGYNSSRLDPEPSDTLLIQMKNGEVRELTEESPLTISYDVIRRLYVFYRGSIEEGKKLHEVCENKFNARSIYRIE
ncbi:MAG: hypothetical protein ACTSRZ_20945 [Promethearchaeota archaeon]